MKYLKYLFLVLYIFATLLICYKSLENGTISSESSKEVTDTIIGSVDNILPSEEPITNKISFDKLHILVRKLIGHFGSFLVLGMLGCLVCFLFIYEKKFSILTTLLIGALTAILSELLQFIPDNRYPSVKDVLIDCCGYFVGIIFIGIIFYLPYYLKKNKVVSH